MAEDMAEFLSKNEIKVRYIHSEIKGIERTELLRQLRAGEFDVLVGINLLREGLTCLKFRLWHNGRRQRRVFKKLHQFDSNFWKGRKKY